MKKALQYLKIGIYYCNKTSWKRPYVKMWQMSSFRLKIKFPVSWERMFDRSRGEICCRGRPRRLAIWAREPHTYQEHVSRLRVCNLQMAWIDFNIWWGWTFWFSGLRHELSSIWVDIATGERVDRNFAKRWRYDYDFEVNYIFMKEILICWEEENGVFITQSKCFGEWMIQICSH